MLGIRKKHITRFLLLLGIVRWYNLALIAASQYLLFWLTFSDHQLSRVFYDVKLHCIVAASLFSVAAAFIINSFYDVDKDLVNKPKQVVIGKLLGESSLLNLYVVLNFFAVGFAMMASIRVMVFFVCYTAFCWFHSHKLQKMPVIREISASLLTMIPLIAIWFHFGHWHWGMFYYIGSLAILLFTREVVKDMAGHKGNLIFGYQTVVVVAGVKTTRWGLVAMNTGFFVMYWVLNWIQMVDPVFPNWHPDYYLIISGVSLFTAFWVSWSIFFIRDDSKIVVMDVFLKLGIVIHLLSIVTQ
jgi:4-hydroxybenzoate polyprenyltransferase